MEESRPNDLHHLDETKTTKGRKMGTETTKQPDDVAALDDKIALYIHTRELEQAISQNKDYWAPNAKPPFNEDAHVGITLKASECEAVFASLPNEQDQRRERKPGESR